MRRTEVPSSSSRKHQTDRNQSNDDAALASISRKIKRNNIKVATIVARCEILDRNGDDLINIKDLESVLQSLLGPETITVREFHHLANAMGATKNSNRGEINYLRLYSLLDDSAGNNGLNEPVERWYDPEDEEETWTTQKGSIGEWLKKAACPAEVQNFKKFIACLEEFERSTGMRCVSKDDGFTVPLGPDLRASISFFMA